MEQKRGKKIFHICMIIVIIAVILFGVGMLVLKYQVEGETNLPFKLSKISIVSSSEGIDKEKPAAKWDLSINQNNDIYLYFEKNKEYNKTEVIKSVTIDQIQMKKTPQIGIPTFYRPNEKEGAMFQNTEENKVEKIEYIGDMETNIKQLKLGNQGGIVVFRYAVNQVGEYVSNDDEQINHSELLKKKEIVVDSLQSSLSFDITVKLVSGKAYKTTVFVDTPVGNIIEQGTGSQEKTDLTDIVFKRIEN